MFGNKYHGDELAKEFYKLITLKKVASENGGEEKIENLAADLRNHTEEMTIDPAEFLNSLDEEPEVSEGLDARVEELDSWVKDQVKPENDCGDVSMNSEDMSYLLDRRASIVLNGLGKIAGSLKRRGENFAADLVEATALNIKKDMIKEAAQKLETINVLSKIASDISKEGDQFTADIVHATIDKIKKGNK